MNGNSKGYNLGSYCDRESLLKYLIHILDKKIEKNPKGKLRIKGQEVSYKKMRKETKMWIKVWFE